MRGMSERKKCSAGTDMTIAAASGTSTSARTNGDRSGRVGRRSRAIAVAQIRRCAHFKCSRIFLIPRKARVFAALTRMPRRAAISAKLQPCT